LINAGEFLKMKKKKKWEKCGELSGKEGRIEV